MSWLVQGLTFITSSLEPPSPSTELPISQTIIQSQVATHQRAPRGPPKQLNLPRIVLERIRIKEQKITHAKKTKPHDLCGSPDAPDIQVIIGNQLSVSDSSASCPPSPIPSVYFTPALSNSWAMSTTTSTCPSPKVVDYDSAHQCRQQVPPVDDTSVEIGDLGKRRGFKGAPLYTQNTRNGSFLSLPTLSPRSGSPTSAQLAGSRSLSSGTPFATVGNLMRNTSPKSPRSMKEVSQDLQDFYDEGDPFATHGETFLTPCFSSGTVLTASLNNFATYYQHKRTHRRMPPLKRKSSYDDLRSAASPICTVPMQTTIYDQAVSVDLPSALVSAKSKNARKRSLHPSFSTGSLSPRIILTSPSIPSSPTRTIYSVANTLMADLPVLQESSRSLEELAKHARSSKVKSKLKVKESFISDPLAPVPGPIVDLYDLDAHEASPKSSSTISNLSPDPRSEMNVYNSLIPDPIKTNLKDKPTRISQDCSVTSVSLPDTKLTQDQEDALSDSDISLPVLVPTANLYEFGAYRSPAKDTLPLLPRKFAHRDLQDAKLPKLRQQPSRVQLRPTKSCLEESDLFTPPVSIKRVPLQELRSVILPMCVSRRSVSAESCGTVSPIDDRSSSPAHCPGGVGHAVRDLHSRSLNEIIAQLDGGMLGYRNETV